MFWRSFERRKSLNSIMIVTTAWMEEWFERFNHEYFDGKLPLPLLALSRAKTRLGQMAFKNATRWGRTRRYDFKISMTTYYDMTDMQAKCVLLHEMIHYVIAYTGLRDTSSHGVVFRGMADNLNRKYGWDIRVMTSTKGWKLSDSAKAKRSSDKPQNYLMLAVEMVDGKHFLSRVNPSFARSINSKVSRLKEVKSYRWYTTQEPYFEDYPQVRSLRGRRISRSDFESLEKVLVKYELP